MDEIEVLLVECFPDTATRHRRTSLHCACTLCQLSQPHPLPEGNQQGRPASEPPIFCYSDWIVEEHEKKFEALMKSTGDDRVKTTEFLDIQNREAVVGRV